MNNKTSEKQAAKKDSILKTLAITGFIGVIMLIAWASIQLVSVVPSAFSSLASLAESVNHPNDTAQEMTEVDTLLVTSDTLLANSGDPVTINWNTAQANGSYTFSYVCADGITVDLVNNTGVQSILCGSNYNIGNVDSTTVVVRTEENRYVDITYSVSFLGTNDIRPRAVGNAALTVFNSDISSEVAVIDLEQDEDNSEGISLEPESPTTPTPAPDASTPTTPITPTTPVTPEYIQKFTYAVPVSNPNGRTDLVAQYLFVGEILSNRFIPGALAENENGAIQFQVKNFGTKTSKDWSFTVSLPGGGRYESPTQSSLKPNERAVLTVGFNGANVNSHTFRVTVTAATDSNRNNNNFSQRVTFVD
jgi:hypothetical protein